ncbi:MAG: phosphatidate cytidylyltransferase, partial [Cyclobacteriaceae bacterium]
MSKRDELIKRLLAGIVGAFVIIFAIAYSKWSYFAIFFSITLITQWEFYRLLRAQSFLPIRLLGVAIGSLIFSLSFLIEDNILNDRLYFILFPISSLIFFIKLYKKKDTNPFTNIAFFFLGIIYVSIPLSLLNVTAFITGTYNYQLPLGILLILWANDTGAYFAGVNFGRTKLFERVSPKKSWEGSLGGSILALTMSYCISIYFDAVGLLSWIIIAMIIIVAGTYGDLVESMFKRSILIKDSGTAIPG